MKRLLLILLLLPLAVWGKRHTIKSVETVNVSVPQGCSPRLPYLVRVTYADGTQALRQTRWDNALTRQEQDAAQQPLGTTYTIKGYIIGDNTSAQGYPIEARVTVADGAWKAPATAPRALPLPLADVQLTGDNRLTSNRDLDTRRLLSLDPRQQLYNYYDTYGLPTDGLPVSDGWDSPTTKLKGHGTGHYLSALAFAYASARDEATRLQLYARLKMMTDAMRQCQERTFVWSDSLGRYFEARDYAPEAELKEMKGTWQAFDEYKKDYSHYGYGYLNAIPAAHCALIECYRAYNNEEWVWAPYYTVHKQLAGLIDIATTLAGRGEREQQVADKALLIAKDMGLWVWNRMHYRTYVKADGTRAERQARPGNRYEMWNMYIAGEVGGMEESLARLSQMVTDGTERAHLLEAAQAFDAPAFFDPVTRGLDDIRTRHANQHIPMITGALSAFRAGAGDKYYNLALNFWLLCQGRYVYATGGVGNGEMFRQPYTQMLSMNTSVMSDYNRHLLPNPDINETCCAYNLAKLTRDLNGYDPDNAALMDYYERVLYNQIIGSVNPHEWGVCYQYAVGMNATKPFGNETPQSTCCGGTGVENHVKYPEAAYFASTDSLWVCLYMPTRAQWRQKGVTIEQQCEWPADHSVVTIAEGSARFTLSLRVPYWATQGFEIRVNGKPIETKRYTPSTYVAITRDWTKGDRVEVRMPFQTHINFGPDKMDLAATGEDQTQTPFLPQWVGTVMYGPLAMATSDVKQWSEADVSLSDDLRELKPQPTTPAGGTDGNIYSLKLTTPERTLSFTPDYYQTEAATHYLRLDVASGAKARKGGAVDASALRQAIGVAEERREAQDAWNALTVKVPAFAPWAPNGYARLLTALADAQKAADARDQQTIDKALTSLNVAINTMRPGNLAEPEDLNELLPLLTQSKNIANKSTALREAINYADMVVGYVNDGSGTHDLITKAIARLREAK